MVSTFVFLQGKKSFSFQVTLFQNRNVWLHSF